MKYIVHIREKRTGQVTMDASSPAEAIADVKRLIQRNQLPPGTIEDSGDLAVTFVEEKETGYQVNKELVTHLGTGMVCPRAGSF